MSTSRFVQEAISRVKRFFVGEPYTEITEKEIDIISSTLNNLLDNTALDTSRWLSSYLVKQRLHEHPQLTKYEALREVISETIGSLPKEDEADILRKRHLEGVSNEALAQKLGLSTDGTYKKRDRIVEKQFARLLWEKEQRCKEKYQTIELKKRRIFALSVFSILVVALAAPIIDTQIFPNKNNSGQIDDNHSPNRVFGEQNAQPSVAPSPPLATKPIEQTPSPIPGPVAQCGGKPQTVENQFTFLTGIPAFTKESTQNALPSNIIRTVAIDNNRNGIWLAFSLNGKAGLAFFTNKTLEICQVSLLVNSEHINALFIDKAGNLWAGTDRDGIGVFNGERWRFDTPKNSNLPSTDAFCLFFDKYTNRIFACTNKGIAVHDGEKWSLLYDTASGKNIRDNDVHGIIVASNGDQYVGYIDSGMSVFRAKTGDWQHFSTTVSPFDTKPGGNHVRSMVLLEKGTKREVWFATFDGGISVLEEENGREKWRVYNKEDGKGLPSNEVLGLAVDKENRIWAATAGGAVYLQDEEWRTYTTGYSYSIAFGTMSDDGCDSCEFTDDNVWTGTKENGVTHSRLPPLIDGVKFIEVCFRPLEGKKDCYDVPQEQHNHTVTITRTVPFAPGEQVRFDIVAGPLATFPFSQSDFLRDVGERRFREPEGLGGIESTVFAGDEYKFSDDKNPLVAPELDEGNTEQTFVTTWRMWAKTRFLDPTLRIVFTVKKPEQTATPTK